MKKTCIVGLLSLALSAIVGSAAHAQTGEDPIVSVPKPTTIKLGVFLPSDSNVKDLIDKTWFAVGADYAFASAARGTVVPIAYVDYLNRSKNYNVGSGASAFTVNPKISSLGVGVGIRSYVSMPTTTKGVAPYIGAGLGVYFNSIKATNTLASGSITTADTTSSQKTTIGFKLNAGVEINRTFVLEADYTRPGNVDNVELGGFDFYAGVRF